MLTGYVLCNVVLVRLFCCREWKLWAVWWGWSLTYPFDRIAFGGPISSKYETEMLTGVGVNTLRNVLKGKIKVWTEDWQTRLYCFWTLWSRFGQTTGKYVFRRELSRFGQTTNERVGRRLWYTKGASDDLLVLDLSNGGEVAIMGIKRKCVFV